MPIAEINWGACLLVAFLAGMKLQETIHARRRAALIQIGRETIASAINRIKGRDLGGGDRRGDAGRLADVQGPKETRRERDAGTGAANAGGNRTSGDQGGDEPQGQEGGGEAPREEGRA